ncbi:MAG TPA: leucyl aminopeptidase family protein [Dermatophilaceae bacterium]|nr:leucyl aminopeptidase family protein [Dermatophilaceae bacterium]
MPEPVPPVEDLLDPAVAPWSVSEDLGAALVGAADSEDAVLVSALQEPGSALGDRAVRTGLGLLGLPAGDVLAAHEPSPEAGEVTTVPLPPGAAPVRALLVVGVGAGTGADLRVAAAAVGRATRGRGRVVLDVDASAVDEPSLSAWVEGAVLGGWAPPRWTGGTVRAGAAPAGGVVVVVPDGTDPGDAAVTVERARIRAHATLLARTLAAVPSDTKNPPWLAERAVELAGPAGLRVRVWDDADLRDEGFGGLLAVGGGSATPPRLVELEHVPAGGGTAGRHVVLVGKGITFDSGGLQVKPPEGMLGMKTDMQGAAVVLAVLAACRDLGVRVRVTGLLALAENAVGAASYRPGDVLTHYDGTTVEVGNTDAEGRLVLADALAYAVSRLAPDAVVDVATLTGAARVALARVMAPVFATDDGLRDALVAAGEVTGETLWPLPLAPQYRRGLDSDVADLRHIAEGGPGAITAALFLREFVGDRPWAHLDIAGPGRSDVDAGLVAKGGTGFGTRLLLRWLEGQG